MKPREWFLHDGGPGFQAIGIVARGPELDDGHTHVIEYSAFERLKKAIDYIETCHLAKGVKEGLKKILSEGQR